ncbi:unnamed protein product [Adineta ricciae]|uniref:Rab-GAP TBC domain-containing protein n=1 Tax=Adineta ricciae TaxID=249248 RepID=A0A814PWG1_ADIRI|nr:unnamed protein product [Adineta ricciae]CAF1211892.1 unnamed protein product [Adineta ricciae]
MGTKGDESNQLILGQLKILFERFHKKQIRKTELEKNLISYARKTGFINNTYRKQAWNLLINTSDDEQYTQDQQQLKSHQYYEQTRLDVIRTLKRFPPNYSEAERSGLQDELIVIINQILVKHRELHYYQGYHDICLTFLLVLGNELCVPILDSITMSHLKYFMEPTMEKTRDSLNYLMPLINCIHSKCAEYMERGGVGHVIFALPWFITWYSHVLDELDVILRLYDLFIVSDYLMPIYVAAEIVNYYGDEILSQDCDMATLHQYLSCLPTEIDTKVWETIIERASHLIDRHPPETLESLASEWKIKCKHIEKSSPQSYLPQRANQLKTNSAKNLVKPSNVLSRVMFWSVALAVGGLAIYLYNQSSAIDLNTFLNLGDIYR